MRALTPKRLVAEHSEFGVRRRVEPSPFPAPLGLNGNARRRTPTYPCSNIDLKVYAKSDEMPKQQQKKRRNRKPVSCWPCRERKVRCDQGSPCATCWRRDHVHLCKMEHPGSLSAEDSQALYGLPTPKHNSTTESGSQSSSPTYTRRVDVAAAKSGNESGYEQLIALLDDISQRLAPTYIMDDITRERIYLGMNCAANFFRELSLHASGKPLLPGDVSIESAFGLTNRTTLHPFGSLWSYAGDVSLGNILKSLPAVEVCLR